MGRAASSGQDARRRARSARLDRARSRRLALDTGRVERDARIDAALADVYQAQEDKLATGKLIADADQRIGQAIRCLTAERLTIAHIAVLCELSVPAVQRLKSEGSEIGVTAGPTAASLCARPDC